MKNIAKKILLVQKEVQFIKKNGRNDFHGYDYTTEADALAIKEIMNKHGLIAIPSVVGYETIQHGDKLQVLSHIKYTVIDSDSGEMVESLVLGQGEDKGDKAAYKAATGASKYFHLKFAGAATGDDPETENLVDTVRHQNAGQHFQPQKPVQQAPAQPTPQQPQPISMEKRRAEMLANEIKQFQRTHGLSDEQVKHYGGIKASVDGLAEKGYAGTLEKALKQIRQAV